MPNRTRNSTDLIAHTAKPNPFKVGDRVVCHYVQTLAGYGKEPLTLGREYTVTTNPTRTPSADHITVVDDTGSRGNYMHGRFEMAPTEAPEPAPEPTFSVSELVKRAEKLAEIGQYQAAYIIMEMVCRKTSPKPLAAQIVDDHGSSNKIACIKAYRQITGASLKDAKEAIDAEYDARGLDYRGQPV